MARRTRYATYTQEMRRTIQQLVCDDCGEVTDVAPLERPEGWATIILSTDTGAHTYDFCSFEHLAAWVAKDSAPGTLLATLEASVEAVKREHGLPERSVEALS